MLFISKSIRDPRNRRPNLMGMTVGLTVHAPKFWDCKGYDFYTSQLDAMRNGAPLPLKVKERRYLAKKAHEKCRLRHLSYAGYLYWTGPRRRYQFNYMGPLRKLFEVYEHGTYVRWLDNGLQNPPVKPVTPRENAALRQHRLNFVATLDHYREQMNEYARQREEGQW